MAFSIEMLLEFLERLGNALILSLADVFQAENGVPIKADRSSLY